MEYIRPAATVITVDTAEVFLRRPYAGLRGQVEAATGERPHIEDVVDRTKCWRGARLIVNRPNRRALSLMSGLIGDRRLGCCISRVDIAVDFSMDGDEGADALFGWFDRHVILKWRSPRSRKKCMDGTVYWADKCRARNLVVYMKAINVIRLELRFFNARAVRRAGLNKLETLESVNMKKLIGHNLKAERFTERHILNVVRRTFKQDMVRHQGNQGRRYHDVTDLYRSRIPARVRSTLTERADMQEMRAGRGTENVDMSWLGVPCRVSLR